MNNLEQKYAGYGHHLTDGNGNIITIVKHFIEIQTMNRTAVGASNLGPNGEHNPGLDFLEYHREQFLKNESKFNTDVFGAQVDPFMTYCGPSEFVLEGHTHPDLGVFFSGPDKTSGAARAASSPTAIFVCDPVRRQCLAAVGKDFARAEVIMYSQRKAVATAATQDRITERRPDKRLPPPMDEIVRLTSQCIQYYGFKGNVKIRTSLTGKTVMKTRLAFPKKKGGEQ